LEPVGRLGAGPAAAYDDMQRSALGFSIEGHPDAIFDGAYSHHADHDGSMVLKSKKDMYCYYYRPKKQWLISDRFTPDSDVCSAAIGSVYNSVPEGAQPWQCLDLRGVGFVTKELTVQMLVRRPTCAPRAGRRWCPFVSDGAHARFRGRPRTSLRLSVVSTTGAQPRARRKLRLMRRRRQKPLRQ